MSDLATTQKAEVVPANSKEAKTLGDYLRSAGATKKMAEVASGALTPEAMTRLALLAANRNPAIADCRWDTVLRSLLDAAELGITPGGMQGRGYLVPRKGECCFDPGWRGLIDIARRSGAIASISAHVVREKDKYEVTFGVDERIEHKPFLGGDAGPIVGAYAVARFKDGSHQIEFLTRADIDKISNTSAAKKSGPWGHWEDEMARKTAVRRLCKYLPYEPKLERAMQAAGEADEDFMESSVETAATKAKALSEKLKAPVQHDSDGVVP